MCLSVMVTARFVICCTCAVAASTTPRVEDLPGAVQSLVFSFLSPDVTCRAMIQDRSFNSFLHKIQSFGLLESRDAATDFFVRGDREDIEACLSPVLIESFWLRLLSPLDNPKREDAIRGMQCVRDVALTFLNSRRELSAHITGRELMFPRLGYSLIDSRLYKTIGLLASRIVSLDLVRMERLDLSPLSTLVNLNCLCLTKTKVDDLKPLSKLVGLLRLYLDRTDVEDITPLSSLINLWVLFLGSTRTADVRPLAGLKDLRHLRLNDTLVRDVSPLVNLRNLRMLDLDFSLVSDIRPLRNLVANGLSVLKG